MVDLGPFMLPVMRVLLAGTYVYLLAGITRSFGVWFWLVAFIFMPPEVQTMALACTMLWGLRQEKVARDTPAKTVTPALFGPRPVR